MKAAADLCILLPNAATHYDVKPTGYYCVKPATYYDAKPPPHFIRGGGSSKTHEF